ncbi:MAG TPA: AAA family ATPase [Marmoricola sp.]|nr:AAA family ATPase [Marmoricola sp.]
MELLERGRFLDALGGYADEACTGTGRFVLVTGEAGIGKTSLLEAFRDSRPDLRWLTGGCDGTATPQPLGPLHEIAHQLGDPFLAECRATTDRHHLFTSFLDQLDEADAVSAVVVEDVHWADQATLDWLVHLGRRVSRRPSLVVVSYRDDDAGNDSRLRRAIGLVAGYQSTARLALPRLSPDAVRRLAGDTAADAERLHALTGGNPLYVTEVLDAGLDVVPPSVADVVIARFSQLGRDAQALVRAAAVLAAPSGPDDLAGIAGVDPHGLDDCVERGLLTPGAGGYRFHHELTRRAVEAAVPDRLAADLHAATLRLLEVRPTSSAARMAHHAEAAGDAAAVLRHAPEAARRAAAMQSHRESVAQYERALRFVDDAPAGERAGLAAAMHEGAAEALALMDRWDESLAHREPAVAHFRELGDPVGLSRNLRRLSVCLWRLCRGEESEAARLECYHLMRDAPESWEKAAVLYNYGVSGVLAPESAIAHLQEAGRIAEQVGAADLAANVISGLGYWALHEGKDEFAMLERGLEQHREHGFDILAAADYTNLYQYAADLVRLDEFEWVWDEGSEYCADRDFFTFGYCLRGARVQALLRRGRLQQAVALAEETLRLPISPVNRLSLLVNLVPSLLRLGDPRAPGHLAEAWQLARADGEVEYLLKCAIASAQAAWLTGDRALLDDDVRAALDRERDATPCPWHRGELAAWLHRLGVPVRVSRHLLEPWSLELADDWHAAARWWQERGCPYEQAVDLLWSGDRDSMHEALEVFDDLGAEPAAAITRRRLREAGEVSVPRGPRRTTRDNPHGLTARQADVLDLVGDGLTNREIAQRLFLSERTVENHVGAALTKLGVSSRTEAARLLAGSADGAG